ncbi:hypothetical protein JHK84_033664 [Glycine max]|nr:hypothetical protein JHK84_033664 [Glycine max]
MNELDEYQNQVRAEAVSAKKDNDKPGSNRGHDEGRRDRPPQESHFTQYIPLTANKSHIMDQALVVNILTMLKKTNTPSKADYSKHYCHTGLRGENDPSPDREETGNMQDGRTCRGTEVAPGRKKKDPLTNRGGS